MFEIKIPLSVPRDKKTTYLQNYKMLTAGSGNLFLIAADQKVEHLNADFFGPGISPEDATPEHIFKIASSASGAVLASHLGLISRYGQDYKHLPYIVKLNGKTNLGDNENKNSAPTWWTVADIVKFKKESGLKIVGVGYTLYLGGQFEDLMLEAAAKMIFDAHQNGLTAILWVYPRGKNVKEEDVHIIAGGAGVAASLDADFVKVKYPYALKDKKETALKFKEVTAAAGRTKVICVGGAKQSTKELLAHLNNQLKFSDTAGLAIGRNLHQRSFDEAKKLAADISALIFEKAKKPKKMKRLLGLF